MKNNNKNWATICRAASLRENGHTQRETACKIGASTEQVREMLTRHETLLDSQRGYRKYYSKYRTFTTRETAERLQRIKPMPRLDDPDAVSDGIAFSLFSGGNGCELGATPEQVQRWKNELRNETIEK